MNLFCWKLLQQMMSSAQLQQQQQQLQQQQQQGSGPPGGIEEQDHRNLVSPYSFSYCSPILGNINNIKSFRTCVERKKDNDSVMQGFRV